MDNLKQSGLVKPVTPTVPNRAPVRRKPGGDSRQRDKQQGRQHPQHGPDQDHRIDEYA